MKLYVCFDCSKAMRSLGGLTRHTTMIHLREPMPDEKEPQE